MPAIPPSTAAFAGRRLLEDAFLEDSFAGEPFLEALEGEAGFPLPSARILHMADGYQRLAEDLRAAARARIR